MRVDAEIEITADDLASFYVNNFSDWQAEFINLLGKKFNEADFDRSYQYLSIADRIDSNGMDFLYTLSNWVKVRKIPLESPKFDVLSNFYK